MMDTPFTRIVEGLNHTLENVIAPEIESVYIKYQKKFRLGFKFFLC